MPSSFLPQVRKAIAKGFRGRLLKGTVRRRSTILNEFHDVETLTYTDYSFDGMREFFDAQYQTLALIPATDVKILVILGSLAITPTQEDLVQIPPIPGATGVWHKVRRILSIDPASASMSLQAFPIPDADAN